MNALIDAILSGEFSSVLKLVQSCSKINIQDEDTFFDLIPLHYMVIFSCQETEDRANYVQELRTIGYET